MFSKFKHSDFQLRPAISTDKWTVLEWRNSERVRTNMYTTHVIKRDEHEEWFDRVQVSTEDEFLVFEYLGRPIGVVAFSRIDPGAKSAVWAFYLGETDVPKGCGSVMEFFALEFAFDSLKLRKLHCEVIEFNAGVVKLHKRFGFVESGFQPKKIRRDGRAWGVHALEMDLATWVDRRDDFRATYFEEAK